MNEPSRHGCRGYIGSRPYNGDRVPQHVQNLVVRDYCQRHGLTYLLSATEYAMPACYMMLEEVIAEAPRLDGVVFYSLFMLPEDRRRRIDACRRILDVGAGLHGAVENIAVSGEEELQRVEDVWRVRDLLGDCTVALEAYSDLSAGG